MALSTYDTVIVDIEGTITPITFVKDVLFPYVTNNLEAFLNREWDTDMEHHVELLREQAKTDIACGMTITSIPTEAVATREEIKAIVKENIIYQVAVDRKVSALKSFQGYMWKEGYFSGELLGQIYDDVVPALDKWTKENKSLYIYSSGSVPAQKLLVGYSDKGDLTKYFHGYFDTAMGLKVEKQSYLNIAAEINKDPSTILFITDSIYESIAARKAGYQVIISDRPGNAPLPPNTDFKIVTAFDQI
ncbi:2,3-diketo-5-methylthio-1-phosphopentane phosphatase [Spinellus fusiger]|nr:2,3-diketo-5-methylthio-1-phosphopentane phosphatase [Spinellus fusiger]